MSELRHIKVDIHSGGEPASSRRAHGTVKGCQCEIIQQQSQRHCHQSNGRAEQMAQIIRNQIQAYKIKIEKNSGITIKVDSPLLTWLPRRVAWQYTRSHKRQDSTTACEKIRSRPNLFSLERRLRADEPGALVNKMESAWHEGVWLGRNSETDEHLIGTPNCMVRSRAMKRRVEIRRWDTTLLNATVWDRHQSREEDH